MCLLIVLTAVDADYPILVASNRDESRARKAAPPGLFVGERRRILSPRDRLAGGTWIGVNDAGLFAGLTNLDDVASVANAPSRGHLTHLALDSSTIDGAVSRVESAVAESGYAGFQIAISDGAACVVLSHEGGDLARFDAGAEPVVITNRHRPGGLRLPGLDAARDRDLGIEERFDRLAPILLDRGDVSGHPVLKTGGEYGTVSSSLIAVRPGEPRALQWRYAPGPPDATDYRNYGNLSRRLVEG